MYAFSPPPEADSDYTSVTASQFLSSTVTRVCQNISTAIDNLVEGDETFTVELSSSSNDVTLITQTVATVVILDANSKAV